MPDLGQHNCEHKWEHKFPLNIDDKAFLMRQRGVNGGHYVRDQYCCGKCSIGCDRSMHRSINLHNDIEQYHRAILLITILIMTIWHLARDDVLDNDDDDDADNDSDNSALHYYSPFPLDISQYYCLFVCLSVCVFVVWLCFFMFVYQSDVLWQHINDFHQKPFIGDHTQCSPRHLSSAPPGIYIPFIVIDNIRVHHNQQYRHHGSIMIIMLSYAYAPSIPSLVISLKTSLILGLKSQIFQNLVKKGKIKKVKNKESFLKIKMKFI